MANMTHKSKKKTTKQQNESEKKEKVVSKTNQPIKPADHRPKIGRTVCMAGSKKQCNLLIASSCV